MRRQSARSSSELNASFISTRGWELLVAFDEVDLSYKIQRCCPSPPSKYPRTDCQRVPD